LVPKNLKIFYGQASASMRSRFNSLELSFPWGQLRAGAATKIR
jgi:hypothetical protein